MQVYKGVSQFFEAFLTAFIASGKSKGMLNVLFATHNRVNEFKYGLSQTVKQGLSITIKSGNVDPYSSLHAFTVQPDLVFVYVSLSAFDSALRFAHEMKANATVVILTCDCDAVTKMSRIQREGFENVILETRCGGDEALSEVAHAILERW